MGKNLSKEQQTMVAVVLLVLGGLYAYWNYMLKPTREMLAQKKSIYQDLVKKIEVAERQARRLPALKNELEQLQVELAHLEKQLPKDKDLPNILRTLTEEALKENLIFSRVNPGGPKSEQYFQRIPFDISFEGSIHALARFLASLGQQERIFRASNISLNPKGGVHIDGSQLLNIKLNIETYVYKG